MYVWGRPPSLHPGETVMWRGGANRQVGRRVAAGRLFVTGARVIFVAARLDNLIWGGDWECDRRKVDSVDIAERGLNDGPFTGGLRRRLMLRLKDQPDELFVVWSAERARSRLAALLGTAPGNRS